MTQEAMHQPNIVLNGAEPPNFASAASSTQIDPTGLLSSKLRASLSQQFVETLRAYPRINYRANKDAFDGRDPY
jgi:hypothetical protein